VPNSGSASRPDDSSGSPAYRVDELRECADIVTSTDDYARRFGGLVGRWFIETQTRLTLTALKALPAGASVLDVGGGHAQIAPPLIEAGYEVTVVGSDSSCSTRLEPWIANGQCRYHVADLRVLPFPDASFDAVVCFRLLPHSISWSRLIGELCRVARRSVIVDYPSSRSVNIASSPLLAVKREIELNTRPFLTFSPRQIRAAFWDRGFIVRSELPEFLLPMVLHRLFNRPLLSKIVELPGRFLGLTNWFGSPVIVRADRHKPLT
jgi:SAM-dependent methyltransferase